MRKIIYLFALISVFSCSKKEDVAPSSTNTDPYEGYYYIIEASNELPFTLRVDSDKPFTHGGIPATQPPTLSSVYRYEVKGVKSLRTSLQFDKGQNVYVSTNIEGMDITLNINDFYEINESNSVESIYHSFVSK